MSGSRASESGQRKALMLFLLSRSPMVPAKVVMDWRAGGVHLPDYMIHLASAYGSRLTAP